MGERWRHVSCACSRREKASLRSFYGGVISLRVVLFSEGGRMDLFEGVGRCDLLLWGREVGSLEGRGSLSRDLSWEAGSLKLTKNRWVMKYLSREMEAGSLYRGKRGGRYDLSTLYRGKADARGDYDLFTERTEVGGGGYDLSSDGSEVGEVGGMISIHMEGRWKGGEVRCTGKGEAECLSRAGESVSQSRRRDVYV